MVGQGFFAALFARDATLVQLPSLVLVSRILDECSAT